MNKKELAAKTVAELKKIYPDAVCSLTCKDPLQLLIAVRLSAQCTDARVNLVTPVLFEKYPTLEALCAATAEEVGEIIKPCGLFNTKARDIKNLSLMIRDEYGGSVPDSMEQLLRLPGVGRKTANLILGDVYGKPAIVVTQYTASYEVSPNDVPTYANLGDRDLYCQANEKARIADLQGMGIDAELDFFEGCWHGFGLGIGTAAEGWVDHAVDFWQRHMTT